jgi:DNA-binding transcriptional LysR family regulator
VTCSAIVRFDEERKEWTTALAAASAAPAVLVFAHWTTVAQRGSMAKAAAHLGVSTPTVSEVISDLEDTLGLKLLDRNPRGVEPNLYGRALLNRCTAAFDELKLSVKDLEFLSTRDTGVVRIGCPEASTAMLSSVMERFWRQYPRVTFSVEQVGTYLGWHRSARYETGFVTCPPGLRLFRNLAPMFRNMALMFRNHPPYFVSPGKLDALDGRRRAVGKVLARPAAGVRWGIPKCPTRFDRGRDHFLCGTGTSERFDDRRKRSGDSHGAIPT